MGDYKWMSFKEVDQTSDYFGNGLISIGQKHKENIAIFAETRAEWMISVQGCFKQNIPGEFKMLFTTPLDICLLKTGRETFKLLLQSILKILF